MAHGYFVGAAPSKWFYAGYINSIPNANMPQAFSYKTAYVMVVDATNACVPSSASASMPFTTKINPFVSTWVRTNDASSVYTLEANT